MPDLQIEHFTPELAVLPFRMAEVTRTLGYEGDVPDYVQQALDDLWQQTQTVTAVQCGYVRLEVEVEKAAFHSGGQSFQCGTFIGRHLYGACELAVFVASLGPQFDQWSQAFFDENDPFLGYLGNAIGSVLAESVVDWLESRLQVDLDFDEWQRSNRVSPGYCRWDVREQQKLFALLPDFFCGITLTDSCLMIPIKSVSGVIGIGPQIQRLDYGCGLCDQQDCIMRRSC